MNILDLGSTTDTVQITDPLFQNVHGTGIKVGKGSEVRVVGGRIFGQFGGKEWVQGSIGIRVTGDNGGVHVISTDLIGLETGLLLENSNGQGSNREIFLSQATVDSNYRGMVVNDNSYIDFSGVWTASSGDANIYVAENASPIHIVAWWNHFQLWYIQRDWQRRCDSMAWVGIFHPYWCHSTEQPRPWDMD